MYGLVTGGGGGGKQDKISDCASCNPPVTLRLKLLIVFLVNFKLFKFFFFIITKFWKLNFVDEMYWWIHAFKNYIARFLWIVSSKLLLFDKKTKTRKKLLNNSLGKHNKNSNSHKNDNL